MLQPALQLEDVSCKLPTHIRSTTLGILVFKEVIYIHMYKNKHIYRESAADGDRYRFAQTVSLTILP